jgi:lauroyl/myristoyl acyltransferase
VVVRESYDPRLDPLVDSHRHQRGVEVIHRGRPGAAFRIVRVLRQGRPVGFLSDLGGRVARAPTHFLGWVVDMPIGPTFIAVRTRAPLLVGTLSPAISVSGRPPSHLPLSGPTRYVLTIRQSEASDEPALRQKVAHELGERIRAARHHWLGIASGFPWLRDNRTTP